MMRVVHAKTRRGKQKEEVWLSTELHLFKSHLSIHQPSWLEAKKGYTHNSEPQILDSCEPWTKRETEEDELDTRLCDREI